MGQPERRTAHAPERAIERATVRMTDIEESIVRSLRRVLRAVAAYSRQLERSHDLTTPQLLCLRHLEREGPCCISDLAEAAALSSPTMTGLLDRLVGRRLVERQRSTVDRRKVVVALTEEGRELAEQAPPLLQERFVERLRSLPSARQHELEGALRDVVDMMEASQVEAALVLDSELELSPDEPPQAPGGRTSDAARSSP